MTGCDCKKIYEFEDEKAGKGAAKVGDAVGVGFGD